jgi:hypothetical protein
MSKRVTKRTKRAISDLDKKRIVVAVCSVIGLCVMWTVAKNYWDYCWQNTPPAQKYDTMKDWQASGSRNLYDSAAQARNRGDTYRAEEYESAAHHLYQQAN